jgi:hypothetical protein
MMMAQIHALTGVGWQRIAWPPPRLAQQFVAPPEPRASRHCSHSPVVPTQLSAFR